MSLQLISAVRNGGLGREGIGTSMMMQSEWIAPSIHHSS